MRVLKGILVILGVVAVCAAAAVAGLGVALRMEDPILAYFGKDPVCDALSSAATLGRLDATKRGVLMDALLSRPDVDEITKIVVAPIKRDCQEESR